MNKQLLTLAAIAAVISTTTCAWAQAQPAPANSGRGFIGAGVATSNPGPQNGPAESMYFDISDELAKGILDHLPAKAAVTPEKPRRLLVYIQANQFVTPGMPYVNRALWEIGKKTGAFSVDVSADLNDFLPDRLK